MMAARADLDWTQWEPDSLSSNDSGIWFNQVLDEELAGLELGPVLECQPAPPAKRRKVSIMITTTAATSTTDSLVAITQPKLRKYVAAASTANNARKSTKKSKPISSHIPFEIWLEIFAYCPPSQLAKLRRVNSSFKAFIDDEKLWARSRQNTFPSYPEPMYGFPENYMWNLWKGSGCEICGAPRFKKCYWTWGIRLCTKCFKDNRIRGDEIEGDREFVNAALVCLRHCFVSGKFVSTQRGNYYGLGGGDPCYWKDEVAAFRATYEEKRLDLEGPAILATFLEIERDKVKFQMEAAVKMCEFERQDRSHVLMLHTEATARREELAEIRRQRLISIPEKCKQYFTPPILDGVLELIPSYQTALKAGSVLTDRGWKTLVTKITSERSNAEAYYRSLQEAKESEHRRYKEIKEKVKSNEIRDYRNLVKLRGAMRDLVKLAREFIKKEAGYVILENSRAQSFVLEAMKFCRRRWYENNEGQTLPFRSAYFLWEEVLEAAVRNFKDAEFCCEYCRQTGTWENIIFHLALEHHEEPGMKRLARKPVEFAAEEKVIYKRHIPNWDGAEWPEKIPVLSTGLKFTPRVLKDKASRPLLSGSSSSTASNKPRKPRKPGTSREGTIGMLSSGNGLSAKLQKPHTTPPRDLISRIIVEVSDIPVPPFFQLSLFFRKMVAEFKHYKRVEFNELYYEFIRLCGQDHKAPSWFQHDTIVCKACNHTWDGAQSIVTLMEHFFDFHHQNRDWREDMLLMPNPLDILGMLGTVGGHHIEHRWDMEAEEHGLDGDSARAKQALSEENEEVLCTVEELKALQVLKRAEDVRDIMMDGEFERKRKREWDEGKGKGKERECSPYDEWPISEVESEECEDTFDEFSDCVGVLDGLGDLGWLGELGDGYGRMNVDEGDSS